MYRCSDRMTGIQRRKLITIGTGAILALGGVGTAAARGGPPSEGDTIVDVASGDDRFETLVAAVQEAGLVDALSGNKQLTVFAPTDKAFGELGITKDNVDKVDGLANILLYHVTNGRRNSNSVVNAPQIEMLNGETVAVDGTELNDGQAEIVDTDIPASNGVIHVIDGVLLPE